MDWTRTKVADVGAGRGGFSKLLGDHLMERHGIAPANVIRACDLMPQAFEYPELSCEPIRPDGSLPYEDGTFDAVVSMEVIEHVEDQFRFLRELVRIARPGGLVLVTTPNTHHMVSRLRTLTTGFPTLYDPLPLSEQDPQRLGGHIPPIAPYFLLYAAQRAGLTELRLLHDRRKVSALALTACFFPMLWIARLAHRSRIQRKRPALLADNRDWLAQVDSLDMLCSRTTIVAGRAPSKR
jgi:SAM-dependent methyltransferase